jgi:hypothetical protein
MTHFETDDLREIEHAFADVRDDTSGLGERAAASLDRMVMFGEGHLRRAVASYMKHYHLERCHQGIGNRPIEGVPELAEGSVARLERLGGILSHFYRRAA